MLAVPNTLMNELQMQLDAMKAQLDRIEALLSNVPTKDRYSTDEAAPILKLSPWTVRQKCKLGEIN